MNNANQLAQAQRYLPGDEQACCTASRGGLAVPCSQNEIPSEMDSLSEALKSLDERLSILRTKLGPVLADKDVCTPERAPAPPINTKLGGELRSLTSGVHGMQDRVSDLIERTAL